MLGQVVHASTGYRRRWRSVLPKCALSLAHSCTLSSAPLASLAQSAPGGVRREAAGSRIGPIPSAREPHASTVYRLLVRGGRCKVSSHVWRAQRPTCGDRSPLNVRRSRHPLPGGERAPGRGPHLRGGGPPGRLHLLPLRPPL